MDTLSPFHSSSNDIYYPVCIFEGLQLKAEKMAHPIPEVYCLRTSQNLWDEKTLWKTYTMLTDLEAVFRSLKTELGFRPVYHQKTDRITGHLFISVLAYHLVHSIRYELKQAGISMSWNKIKEQLVGQSRITVSMQQSNGDMIHIRKSTKPEYHQKKIYDVLALKAHPGRIIKKIIDAK